MKIRNVLKTCIITALAVLLTTACIGVSVNARYGCAYAADNLSIAAKSSYLVDYETGSVIAKNNENERLPIASMVKIMTALMTFEAVDRGELSFDDDVTVSAEAAGMGGSQVFLDANTTHKVSNLVKSVIVCSANDSCVALAEKISGSVSSFVAAMNARAKELGMENTRFANCTGLPAAESFSSAKDVAQMFVTLLKHPKYYEYAGVWLEDYIHPDGRTTSMTNTNKLVRFYNGCDGGKTGFTSEAKFCLAATAKRDGMRIVAVVVGEESSKQRFADVSRMFDYAFGNYSNKLLIASSDDIENSIEIVGGKSDTIRVGTPENLSLFSSRNDTDSTEVKFEMVESVKAPVKAGDTLGTAYAVRNGVVEREVAIVAKEDIAKATYSDDLKKIAENW